MRSIDWWHCRWPWVTPNHPKPRHFVHFQRLLYLRNALQNVLLVYFVATNYSNIGKNGRCNRTQSGHLRVFLMILHIITSVYWRLRCMVECTHATVQACWLFPVQASAGINSVVKSMIKEDIDFPNRLPIFSRTKTQNHSDLGGIHYARMLSADTWLL